MDLPVLWLRRHVVQRVARRLGVVATVVAVLAGVLAAVGGVGAGPAIAVGLVVGLLAAAGWFVTALFTNPLDHGYLRAYTAEAVSISPEGDVIREKTSAAGPPELRLTIVDPATGEPAHRVFANGHRVLVRSAGSDAVSIYSKLEDGRIVCTDARLTVPHPDLVVNLVRDVDLDVQLERHDELLKRLGRNGVRTDANPDPQLVLDALQAERAGFRQLGSVWGCFLDVESTPAPWRLLVDVAPDELLALADAGDDTPPFARPVRVIAA